MAGASGYEVLPQPTGIIQGLNTLGQTIADNRQAQVEAQQKTDQLKAQQDRQKQQDLIKGINEVNNEYAFSKFATGDQNLDKILAPKVMDIQSKALQMMNNGDIIDGRIYATTMASQLANTHTLASNALKNANLNIGALQKQDPNINVVGLRTDVNNTISSQFINPDGSLKTINQLQDVNIPDDLVSNLVASGKYYSSSAPAAKYFADKSHMIPFKSSYRTGTGGGEDITGNGTIYKPIVKDVNGNYVAKVASEDVNMGSHIAKVMPDSLYETLPQSVKGGVTYSYNQQVGDPKSSLYTDKNSPLYGVNPQQMLNNPAPPSIDYAKRFIAMNIADQTSPSVVNKSQRDNRVSIVNVGGSNQGQAPFHDTFADIKARLPEVGSKMTLNNFSPEVQSYLGHVLYSSGSGLANNQAVVTHSADGRYELRDASTNELIAPLNEEEMNLSTNPKAVKSRKSIQEAARKDAPTPVKPLSSQQMNSILDNMRSGGIKIQKDNRIKVDY